MKYVCLIYTDEKMEASMSKEEQGQLFAAYGAFTQDVQDQGIHVGGEALLPTSTAKSVQVRDGQTLTTDGPFAETKEQLGGYYLFDCKDLDEALATAAKIPSAVHGTIEVRPVMVFEDEGG